MKNSIRTLVAASMLTSMLTLSTVSMAEDMLGLDCSMWKRPAESIKKLHDNGISQHQVLVVTDELWKDMPVENQLMMRAIVSGIYNNPDLNNSQVLDGIDMLCKEID